MKVSVDTFWAQKVGARPEQYEDASYPPRGGYSLDAVPSQLFNISIAEHLVSCFGSRLSEGFDSVWSRARDSWTTVVQSFTDKRESSGRPVQWFEEPGLARGGYATFLTVGLRPGRQDPSQGVMLVWGVGDCCVFQVRKGRTLLPFPFTSPDQFDCTPELLFSTDTSADVKSKRQARCVKFRAGDTLFLMTDAIAAWTWENIRSSEPPWDLFNQFGSPSSSFDQWLRTERAEKRLRDDDVTLMRVTIEDID